MVTSLSRATKEHITLLGKNRCSKPAMKARAVILIIAVGAFVLIALLVTKLREPEPTYNGRTLSEWLAIASTNGDHASFAVQQIGTNALPFVVKWIRHQPPAWKHGIYFFTQTHPSFMPRGILGGWLADDAASRRASHAPLALSLLGTNAVSLAPKLKSLSYDQASPEVRYRALEALGFMDTNALPQLLGILRDARYPLRGDCARILGQIIKRNPDAGVDVLPALAECLKETNTILVLRASEAVAYPRVNTNIVIPPLIKNLSNPDELIRIAATNALEIISPGTLKKDTINDRRAIIGKPMGLGMYER